MRQHIVIDHVHASSDAPATSGAVPSVISMSIPHPNIARAGRALALLALLALSACHRSRTTSELDPDAGEESSTIEFKNESLAQADVFISAASVGARRIGTVFAGRTETLTIPRELAVRGSINVVARLLARTRAPSTGTIAIGPGTHLSIRLPLDEKALYVLPAN